MENLQLTSNYTSGNQLSCLIIPVEEENFEFGFSQIQEYSPESPADHLFLNGKLQPHDFPTSDSSIDRSIDSVLSWRSNSTNSSSSAARTSSIREACGSVSERKSSFSQRAKVAPAGRRKNNSLSRKENSIWKQYYRQNKKPVMATDFSSSLRWQFITPVPDNLKTRSARLRKFQNVEPERKGNGNGAGALFACSRVVRLFMTACLSCHAMHPAGADQ